MARRKTKTRRRQSRMFSILNAVEAYTYASILSTGVMGSSPYGFLTGKSNITQVSSGTYGPFQDGGMSMIGGNYYKGAQEISLSEIIQSPDVALGAMAQNFEQNYQAMAIQSLLTSVSFKFGKRLLRRQISNVNRNIMKPLGIGVKL